VGVAAAVAGTVKNLNDGAEDDEEEDEERWETGSGSAGS